MLASCPASILNHFSTLLGIPLRFGLKPSRSNQRVTLVTTARLALPVPSLKS